MRFWNINQLELSRFSELFGIYLGKRPFGCEMRTLISLFMTLGIVISWSNHIAADDAAQLGSRKHFSSQLSQLESKYSNVSAKGVFHRDDYDAKAEYRTLRGAFQSEITYPELRTGRLRGYPRSIVRSEAERTETFKLGRENETNAWYISGLGKTELESDVIRFHKRYCIPLALAATHIFDFSMRELLEDTKIAWNVVPSSNSGDDGEKVQIVLDLSPRGGYFDEAKVRLDPKLGWVVSDYELHHRSRSTTDTRAIFKGVVSYSLYGDKQTPFPKTVRIEVEEPAKPTIKVISWSLKDVEFGTVKDEQFSLDYFGLGTREPLHKRRVTWFMFFNILLLVCCAGYFALHRKSV